MNLNKIIAFGVSAILSFSTVVSAKTTKDTVSALTPKWEISVESLSSKDEVKNASTAKYVKDYDDSKYDYYKLTYTLTDVGALKNEDWEDVLGIYNITLGLKTTGIKSAGVKSVLIDKTASAVGQSAVVGQTDIFNFTFTADGGVSNPYPASDPDEGTALQTFSGKFEFPFVVAIEKNKSVKVEEFTGLIVYVTDDGKADCRNITMPASLTIGKTPATMNVSLVDKFDNGYVWAADITSSSKNISSFKAKFEAGTDVREREVKNVTDMVSKFSGEGKLSFNVGLHTPTDVTLTKATFTLDGTDVNAPISK